MHKVFHKLWKSGVGKANDKRFRPPFSKGGAVKGAEPLSPLASGEISYTAFLFVSFFFAPTVAKEKAAKELGNLTNCMPLVYNLNDKRSPFVVFCSFL